MNLKLFRVTLMGMTSNVTGIAYGVSYVVAESPTVAYDMVRGFLDKKDLGFAYQRELDKIELVAEADEYTDRRTMLFLPVEVS